MNNEKSISKRTGSGGRVATIPLIPGAIRRDALAQRKYRDLIRKHLDKLIDRLFAEFTGLHFHIAWAPSSAEERKASTLTTACSVCSRISGKPLLPDCEECGARQLAHALRNDGAGHSFICRLGVRNYWLPIRLRNETVGVAYLQALDEGSCHQAAMKKSVPKANMSLSRPEFARASRLLRFVVQHVQTACLADLRKTELTSAGRVVVTLEKEQARLHKALARHLPATLGTPRAETESHPQQLVRQLLDVVETDYNHPITLKQCAVKLGMNAAYLSDLFSHTVGVPFKIHLTEYRLARAKELLSDPRQNLSEVAAAIGYNSENRFRLAFKSATGLSPKLWRETMQCNPDRRASTS